MPFFKKKQKDELVFTPTREDKKEDSPTANPDADKRTAADAVENGPLYTALFDSYSLLPTPKPQKLNFEDVAPEARREETDDETDEEEDEEMRRKLERKEEEDVEPEQGKTPKLKQLNSRDAETFKYFKVFRRQVRNLKDGSLMNLETELEIKDMGLQQNLAAYGITFESEEEKLLFGRTQMHYFVPVERIFAYWEQFQSMYLTNEMKKLKEWLEPEYERFRRKSELLISKGKVTFDTLWYLFQAEGKIFARVRGDMIAGAKIVSRNYSGAAFNIAAKSIKSNGAIYFDAAQTYQISHFRGTMDITDLKCQPMNDDMLRILTARGKHFRRITQGHHYREYKGFLMVQQQWGSNLFKAEGRVMIDLKTFERLYPAYQEYKNPAGIATLAQLNNAYAGSASGAYAKLKLDQLYLTWPTVAGFAFSCKKWGEIRVDNVSRIKYDDQAYERLVMPANKKDLVQALVDQHHKLKKKKKPGFADLISGKGGGCIFLLHGPPGVGKTLTAEAIAEYLHLPLYSVSVGELGTNTKDLEMKLQEILELASIWNAVILMDEADIFLERRADNDVVRNAMVGIFLRLLEYYQGVLFLTTNRVRCFDEAFHSRISVALKYEELSADARELVWNNFFDAAGVELVDPKDLAQFPLNGRQIRNVIQLSRALSQREGTQVDTGHIKRTMMISTQLQEAIKNNGVDEKMKAKIRKNNQGANEMPVNDVKEQPQQ